jgi:DNA methylase
MKPYFERDGIALYHGDCLEVIPDLEAEPTVVITDPVWPNAVDSLAGSGDPAGLLASMLASLPESVSRLVIQIGCDSDPRFLGAVPDRWPFLRSCFLEYVRPYYKGRLLYTNDVAYVFGRWPAPRPGAIVIPGKFLQDDHRKRTKGHPCPRQLSHVRWLVKWFGESTILDPFAGTGPVLEAAKFAGLAAIGIEIEEEYCEIAARRLEQGRLPIYT